MGLVPIGWWSGTPSGTLPDSAHDALAALHEPVYAFDGGGHVCFTNVGDATLGKHRSSASDETVFPLLGFAPPLMPEQLGDPTFALNYGARYPYMTGAMANGIASVDLVVAATNAGLVAAYGAAGQTLTTVSAALDQLDTRVGVGSYCVNVIHSPSEPATEHGLVDLLLQRGVRTAEASAFLSMTPAVVRYRLRGVSRNGQGQIVVPNRVIAKASRVEVATHWLSAPPPKLVAQLLSDGAITADEAALAPHIVMADDLTAEADSGGHTDNRPALALIPTFIALRDRLQHSGQQSHPRTRIGAAGAIATPTSVAAAFSMGAAYVVTGSVNQACIESGTSDAVRQMLAQSGQADVMMAPAADMFEMGVKLQVLKRGTLFPMRAARLFETYRAYDALEALPAPLRESLERDLFLAPLEEIWQQTQAFFSQRNPALLSRAQSNPKQKMALVFRWYLGQSSSWANSGDPARKADYQIWCGPAMGAFNEWAKGSVLEQPASRTVTGVANNLLIGAALALRGQTLARSGIPVPTSILSPRPLKSL
ncbi:MAG: trans-AT polyketide synthase/acyltransferase/oxidoreductase domain-containing protein [Gammaproteobacteria bacterium]|jgi:trans-AT polyketide synthase/acyltransferase/oxidoreductase domain-containing protein